jgi:hypothetical protein
MKTKTLAIMVGATIGLWASAPAWAQTKPEAAKATSPADLDKLVELVRKDVRADKADIVSKTMKLDASQAAAFWPVYKAYEAELQALGDQRLFVIQDLADHFETLNDANAKGLLERSLAIEEQRVALQKKYKDEFLKVLPAKTVARFFQVDSRLNNLVNLQVSSQIPLVY